MADGKFSLPDDLISSQPSDRSKRTLCSPFLLLLRLSSIPVSCFGRICLSQLFLPYYKFQSWPGSSSLVAYLVVFFAGEWKGCSLPLMAGVLRRGSLLVRSYLSELEGHRRGILGAASQFCYFYTKGRKKFKSDGSDSSEENMSKRDLALQQALNQITSSFGKGSIMWLGRSVSPRTVPVISTGSFALDIALGTGGLPKGRVVEVYGPEASGKTTLALHVIAEAKKQGDEPATYATIVLSTAAGSNATTTSPEPEETKRTIIFWTC